MQKNTIFMYLFICRCWRLSDCCTVFKKGVWQPRDFRFEVFGWWKVHPRSQSSAENKVQRRGFTVLNRAQNWTGKPDFAGQKSSFVGQILWCLNVMLTEDGTPWDETPLNSVFFTLCPVTWKQRQTFSFYNHTWTQSISIPVSCSFAP